MGSNRNQETQSQGGQQADGQQDHDLQTARGPGEGQHESQPASSGQYGAGRKAAPEDVEGQRTVQQQVELPEHQGVMTDYVPPSGGMRTEVGDFDSDDDEDAGNAPGAGDEPLPGHMGGGLAGG